MTPAFRTLHRWAAWAVPSARPELRRLPAGALFRFALHGHARITCLGGELWVTGPGTGDQILSAGQSLSLAGHGRVVAEALRDARFVIARQRTAHG